MVRNDELIARQARQIADLTDEVTKLKACLREAKLYIICIGGPLNDNKLKFTRDQLKVFQAILDALEYD